MRYKDSGLSSTSGSWTRVDTDSAGAQTTTNGTAITSAARSTMQGEEIPDFHRKKRLGHLLPHTSFEQTEWTSQMIASGIYVKKKTSKNAISITGAYPGADHGVPWRISDFSGYNGSILIPPPQSVPDYFLQQAAARIYQSGFDALTASAELKKTVTGFKGVTKRILDLGRKFSTRRMLDAWLEGRYAIRPLIYDLTGLHDAVHNFDTERTLWTERAGMSDSATETEVLSTFNVLTSTQTLTRTISHEWSLRGSVSGLIKPAQFRRSLVSTAWELVPYSFVIDWVYGVGVTLSAWQFMSASSQYTSSKGYQVDSTVTYENVLSGNASYNASGGTTYQYVGRRQVRTPAKINLKPQMTQRPLTWDLSLDLQALSRESKRYR